MNKKTVLVTGGAGYIGSHAVVELLDMNYNVIVIDSLENGKIELVDPRAKFYLGNIANKDIIEKIFAENDIFVVMHFAGYIKIEESIRDPKKYYLNNTYATLILLEVMKKFNVKNIIFSSTAAVYGEIENEEEYVSEGINKNPINPYGKSKLMAEYIIIDFAKAYGFNYSIFRYFNVAGAHEKYRIGQSKENATALITLALKAIQEDTILEVYGNDYNTIDGTGVRDYIHVVDLVKAHIISIKILEKNHSDIFNLGNGNGFSVFEIIRAAEIVTGKSLRYKIVERRKGDSGKIVASSEKAKKILKWEIKYTDILEIIDSSWKWMNSQI